MAISGVDRLKRSKRANSAAVGKKVVNDGKITDKGGNKSVKPAGKPKSFNE